MKNIIVLNDFPIYPPDHGGKLRIYNIYSELSSKYKIIYVCFGNNKTIVETKITEQFSEIRVPKGSIHRNIEEYMKKLWGVPVDDLVAMLFCRSNRDLDRIIKRYLSDCDIVVLSLPYMFPVIRNQLGDRFLIYESHNVEYVLKKLILGDGFFKDCLCDQVREIEDGLVKACDLLFVTSELDRDKFEEIYGADIKKTHISPNGTNLSAFEPLYKDKNLDKDKILPVPLAIFMGSGHPPNVEAASTILKDIAPRVQNIYFLICGSVCWEIQNLPKGKNVGLADVVTDEEKLELYRVADIALNPMLSGSGTNIKMLDYMAAGLPIVTTPVGARGLDIDNFDQAIICGVSEFPEKISEVINDKDLYVKLGLNGRELVKEKYDWKKIAKDMAKIYESLG